MSASTGAALVSGCIISDIGNAARLSRDYLGELQPPYQNLLQVTTQTDTLTYIKVFSECMPVSSAPGSDDSRQLLSSLRCRAEERHYIRNRKQFKFHNPENQNERRRPKCKRKTSAMWDKLSIQQNIFVTN